MFLFFISIYFSCKRVLVLIFLQGEQRAGSETICAGLVWRESGCVWEREDIKLAERSEPERALYCVLCELEHKNTVLPIREYGE